MRVLLFCFLTSLYAQTSTPTIGGGGYISPIPMTVAPGQLITLFVSGAGQLTSAVYAPPGPLPTTLAGFSATFHQATDQAVPIMAVQPITTCLAFALPAGGSCGNMAAVTVQIPYNIIALCPICENIATIPAQLAIAVNGTVGPSVLVQPLSDQVHILTSCDIMLPGSTAHPFTTPLPCAPMVTHADGTQVSVQHPAKSGEELVAYAVGLGQTNPPLTTGQPVTKAAASAIAFTMDFNYRSNALATKPASSGPPPVFVGATSGFVGLYQINFIVPPAPAGLAACGFATIILPPGAETVQSNMTVSIGSNFSFDGAGICVQPGS